MKIRTGFVSNSSSSSFCIYGLTLDTGEVEQLLFKEEMLVKEGFSPSGEDIDNKVGDVGLEMHQPPEGDYYIGRSWDSIDEDETGAKFKQSVNDRLTLLFGKKFMENHETSTYSESWYNG